MSKLDRFIRQRDVLALIGLSRTTLWREIERGRFPRSVHISVGRVGWRESEILAWQQNPDGWPAPTPIEAA